MAAEFRNLVVSAVKWTAGARLLAQVFNWAITIIVVRLLTPSDYGLLAMATIVVAFLMLLAELGIGPALVQAREVETIQLSQVFGLTIALNLGLCALLLASAPVVADFFSEPRLTPIIRVLSLQFPLVAFQVIPQSLLERQLRFKAKSLVDLSGTIASGLITLMSAYAGLGVWALVAGSLAKLLWSIVGLNWIVRVRVRPRFAFSEIHKLLSFGWKIALSRLLWFFYSQADVLIAGKLLGKVQLGYYSVSMHLASLPVQRLSGIVNEVAFPAFSRIQEDPARFAGYFLKAVRMLSLFAFPVLWGISSVAPELVAVFLGSKWQEAALPLQLLALVMPVRMISNLLPSIVQGFGRPDVSLKNLIALSIIMPTAFLVGGQWGLLGLSLAWVFVFPLVFLGNLRRVVRIVGLRVTDILKAAARSAGSGLLMYGCVSAARPLCELLDWGAGLRLAFLVGIGAVAYMIGTIAANREGLREAIDIVRTG